MKRQPGDRPQPGMVRSEWPRPKIVATRPRRHPGRNSPASTRPGALPPKERDSRTASGARWLHHSAGFDAVEPASSVRSFGALHCAVGEGVLGMDQRRSRLVKTVSFHASPGRRYDVHMRLRHETTRGRRLRFRTTGRSGRTPAPTVGGQRRGAPCGHDRLKLPTVRIGRSPVRRLRPAKTTHRPSPNWRAGSARATLLLRVVTLVRGRRRQTLSRSSSLFAQAMSPAPWRHNEPQRLSWSRYTRRRARPAILKAPSKEAWRVRRRRDHCGPINDYSCLFFTARPSTRRRRT